MTGTPAPDQLPALIDEGLRIVRERRAIIPDARIYDSLEAQLTYVHDVVHGLRPRDTALDDTLLLGRYAAHEFETSDPPFAGVLFDVQYLYDRRPPAKRSRDLKSAIAAIFLAVPLIGPGAFLLVQRETGTRASATVSDCQASGSGRYRSVHCTGSWTVGGSLLDNGHIVVGTIDGVDEGDIGKTIDVTISGDTAYSRGLALPLLLLGLGLVPVGLLILVRVRPRRSR